MHSNVSEICSVLSHQTTTAAQNIVFVHSLVLVINNPNAISKRLLLLTTQRNGDESKQTETGAAVGTQRQNIPLRVP